MSSCASFRNTKTVGSLGKHYSIFCDIEAVTLSNSSFAAPSNSTDYFHAIQ